MFNLYHICCYAHLTIFTYYMITHTIKLSKNLQATGKQPVHVQGDLIVRACLQFGKHGLSHLFSLKPWKLDIREAFLVAFYYPFEAYNAQRIWSHFCRISSFTKSATLRAQVTWASNLHKSRVRKSNVRLGSIDFSLFVEFDFVRLSNSIEFVLSSIEI